VDIRKEFSDLSREVLNNLLTFATSSLRETGFSAVAAVKTKHPSMVNLENDLRVAILQLQPGMISVFKEAPTSVPLIQV
jgi:hypothetical protein